MPMNRIIINMTDDGIEKLATIYYDVDSLFDEIDSLQMIIDALPGQSPPFHKALKEWAAKRILMFEETIYELLE